MANSLLHTYHFIAAKVGANMTNGWKQLHWGQTPWRIDFHPQAISFPQSVDFAVVGGGFTGLSAAAELRRIDPNKTVAVLEAESVGARSSGHTGGLVLAETASGDLPGLGDVLAGYSSVLRNLKVDADISLPGAWELDRTSRLENSPILWSDSGQLRVAREVQGGTADPGKIVSGLAHAAERHGALVFEGARVDRIDFDDPLTLHVSRKRIRAQRVLIATNSESLEISGLVGRAEPKFTLALATEPVQENKLAAIGLASGKPFYTVDLPYLWGRLLHGNQIIFGSGLVSLDNWRELAALDIGAGEAFELLARLKKRVSGLHPALADVHFSHEWGGPILIAEQWRPVFARHTASDRAIVLGAYSGHGVALSVYLGAWAAEVLLGRRDLPNWSSGWASSETF
jgi:glycine/D-amino acid oxidase-like deaminating enzyme